MRRRWVDFVTRIALSTVSIMFMKQPEQERCTSSRSRPSTPSDGTWRSIRREGTATNRSTFARVCLLTLDVLLGVVVFTATLVGRRSAIWHRGRRGGVVPIRSAVCSLTRLHDVVEITARGSVASLRWAISRLPLRLRRGRSWR